MPPDTASKQQKAAVRAGRQSQHLSPTRGVERVIAIQGQAAASLNPVCCGIPSAMFMF